MMRSAGTGQTGPQHSAPSDDRYRHIKRRCSDLDNDPDRCSVAVWSLESCHTQLSSDQRVALSNLMFTLVTSVNVESENADLKRHLTEVTEQRDSALEEIHRLQSKLENLEQVLKHMRDVAERRQQLEKDHEDAVIALKKRQEEVKRLQQAQVEAKKEHEGAVQLLESTLDTLQSKVKLLEDKCRSQTEQFSLLSQELERFRLQTGNIDLLTSTFVTSELPPPQSCSTPGLAPINQERVDGKIKDGKKKRRPEAPAPSHNVGNVESPNQEIAKGKQNLEAPRTSSKSESTHESSKSCPTPEVDTASEMEELEADSVSLNPEPETHSSAKLQVFLARYSYNPFDGPNENPEAELPITAGEYIYIYGDMDDDGFYEGELMDGRRGLVPSNFVERVSDDDLIAFHPAETNELSQSSGQDTSFLSVSSRERSEEDDDGSSLSPLPMQGNSEGARDVSAVPYPRKLTLIKQLARSIVVGWEPPLVAAGSGNIRSYNIYVDNELRQNVCCGGQSKALIEKLELKTRTYRISVQSMTDSGCSDRLRCTLLVGHGYSLAPTQLRVRSLSATSAEITWQPSNSNYSHALYLNEESCGLTKAGTYWYMFNSLRPSTMYNVKVEARPQRIPSELPLERREPKTTVMQLTTPAAGPPDAPLDVQVEMGPKPGVLLITWLPVTIDAAGTSNGVRVTGYAVYADGQKVLEVASPTAGSVLVGASHLQLLQVSREISVRTMSPSGESIDSVPAHIPSAFVKVPDSPSLSHSFSNTSLICEQASGQNLSSQSERFPPMPLTTSSPCSLHNPPASTSQADFSIPINCIRDDCVDALPVRVPALSSSPAAPALASAPAPSYASSVGSSICAEFSSSGHFDKWDISQDRVRQVLPSGSLAGGDNGRQPDRLGCGFFRHLTVQGRWSPQESSLPINVLEIRAIFLSLRHWERILRGLPVRVQTDNATAVAYVNHQGGTRSSLALAEVSKILLWAEATVPVISAVHIPGVENWAADFLSREGLAAGEWSLHPEVFHQICLRWGTPDVDLTASRINRKVPQFVSRSRDPLAVGVDALAIPWSQFELPYLFPPLPLLPKLLKKIKAEGVPVILIAPDWPRRAWFAELVNLLADAPWRLPDRPDLLSQGPICHPNSRSLSLTAWLLRPRF
ncbi:unnamed protein product [Ranitomeya imitator]|uniref:Peripheral-type benzodiazepine receptor-associated protein 1 n=1 Tax=Ranitomeya imitator TaxID=111125 RepID=A0ABN9KVR8_9NEOB|nr:unnamed protein product [Ranitomeya imitator]